MWLMVTGYLPLYFQGYGISILLPVICHNVKLCSIFGLLKGICDINHKNYGDICKLKCNACLFTSMDIVNALYKPHVCMNYLYLFSCSPYRRDRPVLTILFRFEPSVQFPVVILCCRRFGACGTHVLRSILGTRVLHWMF